VSEHVAQLRALVRRAADAAARTRRTQWVALRAPAHVRDPLAAFERARDADRFFFERPSEARSVAAFGAVHVIEARGAQRFAAADRAARELFRNLHVGGDGSDPADGPLLVGGFAFADAPSSSTPWRDFPPARLVLPEVVFVRSGARHVCSVVRAIEPGEPIEPACEALCARLDSLRADLEPDAPTCDARGEPARFGEDDAPEYRAVADRPHDAYRSLVDAALASIGAGDLEKVVVARSIALSHPPGFAPSALLSALRAAHPSCASFGVARGGAVFLGATPERLLRIAGAELETAAVAGSARRGRSPEQDAALARELLESKKEQAEHAIVVRTLREALAGACRELRVDEAPHLLRLEGIQHLETRLAGTLDNGVSILELVGRLHPTPAVGGAPRDAALAWLARHEQLDRGWYAGAVGFVDAGGAGEFCVALRSALLRGAEARLFAGAGIVAGSEPEAELRETRLKLRALLAPLLEV
jgi:isochorismate synthase